MRDFKAEEEELDTWFTEKKQKLEEDYLKKIASQYGEKPKRIDENKEARRFRRRSDRLRRTYQRKYSLLKDRIEIDRYQKRFEHGMGRLISPIISKLKTLDPKKTKGILEVSRPYINDISIFFENIEHRIHDFFVFIIRPWTDPIIQPIRRPIVRLRIPAKADRMEDTIRSSYSKFIELFPASWEMTKKSYSFTAEKLGKVTKFVGSVQETTKKKMSDTKKEYVTPVVTLFRSR